MPCTSSFGIQVEVGVHCSTGFLEDKQSRGGRTVMSPILSASKFQGLAYYSDPHRLIIVDRGSSETVSWLGRVLSFPQFSTLQVGLIWLRLNLVWAYFCVLTICDKLVLIEMDPFYFW